MDITLNEYDATILLHELSCSDTPVTMVIADVRSDGSDFLVELLVQHEEKHVPDFRVILKSDGTWTPVFKLVPEA